MPRGHLCTFSLRDVGIRVPHVRFNGAMNFFKKNCEDEKVIFFYKHQNPNESYLQGRITYFSFFFTLKIISLTKV